MVGLAVGVARFHRLMYELLNGAFDLPGNTLQIVPAGQWYDWLIARHSFREAAGLLGDESPAER